LFITEVADDWSRRGAHGTVRVLLHRKPELHLLATSRTVRRPRTISESSVSNTALRGLVAVH